MLAFIRMLLQEHKAILSLVFLLLGISGISIYGNVNEFNPWKVAEEAVIEEVMPPEVKVIEKTIEKTIERVVAGVTEQDIENRMDAHIEEYH